MPFPQTTLVPIRFEGGLNSKIASFKLDQPYLETCENGTFSLDGQIDKRSGFGLLSTNVQGGGNISAGAALTTFNGELLLLDGSRIYSYQESNQTWTSKGTLFSTTNSQVRVLNTKVATQSNPDATTAGDVSLYVWEDNRSTPALANGVRYSIVNNVTGSIVLSDQQLYSAGSRPKVISDGTTFFVYYVASSFVIFKATIPVAAPSTVTSNLVFEVTDGQAFAGAQTIPYDVCLYNGAPLIAYASASGIRLGDNGGRLIVSQGDSPAVKVIAVCADSTGAVWVAWSTAVDTHIWSGRFNGFTWVEQFPNHVLNPLQPQVSETIALIEDIETGNANLTSEQVPASVHNVSNHFCDNYTVAPSGKVTLIGQMRGVGLASKPFRYGADVFVTTVAVSNLQATYFTRCLTKGLAYVPGTANIQAANNTALATNFALVSSHSPRNGGGYRTNTLLSAADPVSAGVYMFAGQRKGPFSTWANAALVNLGCAGYVVAFGGGNAFNSVQSNNNLHIVGGVKKIYDGISCVEDNFVLFPENDLGNGCTVALTTGGNLAWNVSNPSQYEWLVVYEWTDNHGQVQRSAPSIAVAATTTTSGQSAVLFGPMLRITEKIQARSSVIVSIYRTQANLPVFYKVTNDTAPIVNDPNADVWTFTDTLSDVAIGANENQYTGSQLPNIAPPPCSLISLYQQRLMINSTEDPGVLWYSQNKFQQGQYSTIALDFNTSFVEGVDSRFGSTITAIGLLDNSLAIFKERSIFLLQGDGPNALDTAGQFNDASLLVSDTGCTNQRSLVFVTQTPRSPGGLLFQSPKGIYLLGRDESLTYIGAPVERYNDLAITSANLLTKTNEIVFTTAEGTALVYNYFFGAWSTWATLPAVDATVWQGRLCILTASGAVMIQDNTGTSYADVHPDGVTYPVALDILTPFIKLGQGPGGSVVGNGGMQGYQSIFGCYLLGTLQEPHVLEVSVAYDYNPSVRGSVLINSTIAGAGRWGGLPVWGSNGSWGNGTLFSNYQFQINVNNPRSQAIQFRFRDVQPTPSKGFSLNGLALEVLALPGPMRLPKQNKVAIS